MRKLFLVGRILVGGYFVYSGVNHFTSLRALSRTVAQKGLPLPQLTVGGGGVLLMIGGASLMLGTLPRLGVGALLVFLIPVTALIHQFWNYDGPRQRTEIANFTRNLAFIGSALMFLGIPEPWRPNAQLQPAHRFHRR
jgi:uncharacterized membrane protein YphA (DoxX/SURF4 family)